MKEKAKVLKLETKYDELENKEKNNQEMRLKMKADREKLLDEYFKMDGGMRFFDLVYYVQWVFDIFVIV
jgi:hypothetical protein